MTTINTFEDLLQALEQNPTLREAMRRHIMTEEVMQLPARVFRLEELVARIATQLEELTNVLTRFTEQTNQRLDKVETDVTELKEGQARLEEGQARLETDVTELKEGQARLEEGQARLETRTERLEAGQARLETDVTALKEGQARLETDVTELKEGQARLETRMDRLETGQIRMSGQLSNLIGLDYQSHVARLAHRWLQRHFQITQTDTLWVSTTSEKQELSAILNQAMESGAISFDEVEDMERTDIVIRGSDPDGNPVHVVIEASLTVQESDIRRAADRAAILEKAVGGPTRAVVIGESISPTDQELADREQVQFIQMMQHGSTA